LAGKERKNVNPLIQIQKATPVLLAALLLACFGLLPPAHAVVPAPDGRYPNFTTAEGAKALFSLTAGAGNTAIGWFSLFSDTTGSFNTATGAGTLLFNTADSNTAFGAAALLFNTTGDLNTAVGTAALSNNIEGTGNVAVGIRALQNNTTGAFNTAIGGDVLTVNTTTDDNTAVGSGAMAASTGSNNTAVGRQAGITSGTGNNNVYIGAGMFGVADENEHTYIRNINTTSVSGMGTDTVTVNLSTGLLGHATSSQRYKENIKPMDNASHALFALKPVTFQYKKEIDQSQSLDYGLIAEQVAQVDSNLAIRDKNGQIESVRYSAINAMLLNEFLKEHEAFVEEQRKVKEQGTTIARLQEQIDALSAGLQTVRAQLEVSKAAPQTVLNRQ